MADATSTISLKVDPSQAKTALADLSSRINQLKSDLGGLGSTVSAFSAMKTEMATLKTQVASLQAEMGKLASVKQTVARSASVLNTSNATAASQLNGHTAAVRKHTEAQAALHSAFRGVAGGLDNLWLSYSRYAVVMAAAYAAVKTVRESISQGTELNYNAQFAAALSSTSTNKASTLALKNNILDQLPAAVKDIPYSTNEAAQALRNMAQAGVDAQLGLQLIPTAAKAAIMGETDLSEAAKDLINTMEVFNLKSNDPIQFAQSFKHVGDVTATVASSTSASFSDVIQSFKAATGVANLYKVSLEEVAATVDVLGKAGIKGSQAGTFTRNFISNLYNAQSKGAKDVKEVLGVSAFDGAGKMKDYVTVVNELFVALNKLNDEGLTTAFEKLFNERSTRPAGQLLESFKELALRVNELKGAEGTLDSFTSKLEGAAKLEWQDAMAKGSDLLSGAFRKSEEDVVSLARSFREFVTDPTIRNGLAELISLVTRLADKSLDASKHLLRDLLNTPETAIPSRAPGAVGVIGQILQNVPLGNQFKPSGRQAASGKIGILNSAGIVEEDARTLARLAGSLKPSEIKPPRTGKPLNLPDRGAEREAAKIAQKIREDNLSSGLKQEQIQLSKELLDIEIRQAAQELSSVEATRLKNAATQTSLDIEEMWIRASLKDAEVAKDKFQVEKFNNDLLENAQKKEKQRQQTLLDTTKARIADLNAIQDTNLASERYIEDLTFEAETLGNTALEVRKLRIERERLRVEQDLMNKLSRGSITPDAFAAEMNANNDKAKAAKNNEDYQRTFSAGWGKAFQDYEDNATNAATMAKDAFQSATSAMEDMLYNFATTGKLTMKDMATSILKTMAQIAARQAAMGLLNTAMNLIPWGGTSSASTTTSTTPGYGGSGLGRGITLNLSAHGNVFSSPSLSAYSNGIYSSPRYFEFAQGAGIFAEAGPEAIMPLTRTASGDLGVRSIGGSASNVVVTNNVTVNQNGESETNTQASGKQGAALARMIEASTMAVITRELRPGGLLYGA